MDYVFTQKEIYIYFCNWQIKHLQILKHGGNIIQGVMNTRWFKESGWGSQIY